MLIMLLVLSIGFIYAADEDPVIFTEEDYLPPEKPTIIDDPVVYDEDYELHAPVVGDIENNREKSGILNYSKSNWWIYLIIGLLIIGAAYVIFHEEVHSRK